MSRKKGRNKRKRRPVAWNQRVIVGHSPSQLLRPKQRQQLTSDTELITKGTWFSIPRPSNLKCGRFQEILLFNNICRLPFRLNFNEIRIDYSIIRLRSFGHWPPAFESHLFVLTYPLYVAPPWEILSPEANLSWLLFYRSFLWVLLVFVK